MEPNVGPSSQLNCSNYCLHANDITLKHFILIIGILFDFYFLKILTHVESPFFTVQKKISTMLRRIYPQFLMCRSLLSYLSHWSM